MNPIRMPILAIAICLSMTSLILAQPDALPFVGMSSNTAATKWQEALITGNGTLGAMVFGNPTDERIVLNHERLYEPLLDTPCPVPNLSGSLPEVRRLLLAGKYSDAYEYSWRYAKKQGFPGIQWTDPYHPACALTIKQESEVGQNYWRTTNFETGEVNVQWDDPNGNKIRRQAFVSRSAGIVVVRITSSDPDTTGKLALVNQDHREKSQRKDKFGGGYDEPVIVTTPDSIEYRCKYARSQRGYLVALKAISVDGRISQTKRGFKFCRTRDSDFYRD